MNVHRTWTLVAGTFVIAAILGVALRPAIGDEAVSTKAALAEITRLGGNFKRHRGGLIVSLRGTKITDETARPGMAQPKTYWVPSIAPSGLAFYDGDKFPGWRGNLFVGALRGQLLVRLTLDGDRVVAEERLLSDFGNRIRDVRAGPDGYIYLLLDENDAPIWRLEPR